MRQNPEARNTSNQFSPRNREQSDSEHRPTPCEAVLARIQDGLLLLDKDWRCTYLNEAAATLLRTPPDQLIGNTVWEILPASRHPRLHREFMRAVEQKVLVRFEESYEPLGPRYEYRCYPAADGLTVLLHDTDSHKQAEGAVPESCQILEKQWERTFDAVPDLIAIIDTQHRMVRVNRAMAQRLGMTAEQCAGAMCYRCVHGTDEPPAFCPHAQLLADGREHTAEIYEERLGGHFLISCTPVFDEDGLMVGSVHVARDITEHRQAEEAVQEANEKLRMQTEKLQVRTNELRVQTEELRVQADELTAANAALHESEERYRRLVENLKGSHFIYVHDTKGVFTHLSESVTDILGYATGEFMAHYGTYLTDHPVNQNVHRHTEGSLQGIRQPPYKVNVRHKDGSTRWLEVQEVPVFDAEGKVIAVEGVAQDITERQWAEEALRESEERHRFLVESVNDWIWEVDRNGVYTYVSPQCREVLGYEPQEIVGKTPYDLMPPDEARRVREVFDATAGQAKPIRRLENVNRRKDGRLVVLETNGAPVLDAQGKLAGYRGIDRDITERKRAEKALRESRERLERAQEIAHLGSWELDLVNDRLTWSDEVYRIFGLAPQEFGATYEAFLDCVHPEDRAAVNAAYTGSLRENRDTYEIEHRVVRKDTGEIRLVHEKCEHFRDDTGRIVRSVGMVHDITERKQAEEALRRSEERYHRLFEDDLTGNFVCTPEGRILLCNPAFAKTFGFSSAQEAVGTSMLDLYLDPKERQALLDELKNRGKIERFEVWRKRRDGRPIYIVENLVGHFSERGELYEIKGYVFDDTERKHAEEALRERMKELACLHAVRRVTYRKTCPLMSSAGALSSTWFQPCNFRRSPRRWLN